MSIRDRLPGFNSRYHTHCRSGLFVLRSRVQRDCHGRLSDNSSARRDNSTSQHLKQRFDTVSAKPEHSSQSSRPRCSRNQAPMLGMYTLPVRALQPLSNSRLLFLREDVSAP